MCTKTWLIDTQEAVIVDTLILFCFSNTEFVTRIGVINKFGWILTLTDPDASVDVVPVKEDKNGHDDDVPIIEDKKGDDSDVPIIEDKTGDDEDDDHDIISNEKLTTPDASANVEDEDIPVIEVRNGDDEVSENEIVHENEYNDVIALVELVEEDENNNVHEYEELSDISEDEVQIVKQEKIKVINEKRKGSVDLNLNHLPLLKIFHQLHQNDQDPCDCDHYVHPIHSLTPSDIEQAVAMGSGQVVTSVKERGQVACYILAILLAIATIIAVVFIVTNIMSNMYINY